MSETDHSPGNVEIRDSIDNGNSIYGEHIAEMREVLSTLLGRINDLRSRILEETGSDPVDHCLARIKSDASMREKCRRKGYPETAESALFRLYDAIGIRLVCSFLNDVYRIRSYLQEFPDVEVFREKDYIRHAKKNGYRSYHMILRVKGTYYVELQLRTISMDTWAALEHQMHYKKKAGPNDALIAAELKRCADELASTDVSMQTIRDMILEDAGRR